MYHIISKDGTTISFDRMGQGAAVILVDGALCFRESGPTKQLAELLAHDFTVYNYDRRGRGASGDTKPYAVEREVDDISALVNHAGGTAFVWGTSSGAVLALDAAQRISGITKVALYEAPLIVDDSRATTETDWREIDEAVAMDRRDDALRLFLKSVGVPRIALLVMRLLPMWPALKAIAHTLVYDGAIVRDLQKSVPLPTDRWSSTTVPTLVMDGGKSPMWMRNGNRALASVLPNAKYRTLKGQTHMLKPKVHAPVLRQFFNE